MREGDPTRFRATVHYDGTEFHGWQLQPEQRTVQGAVEAALGGLLRREVRVQAAGRTDTGVHATGQEISFTASSGWPAPELRGALNARLPSDVWIGRLGTCAAGFHPRFDARGRRYEYFVTPAAPTEHPLRRHRTWAVEAVPEAARLVRAAAAVVGERDFDAFGKSGQPERGTRCRVKAARWERTPLGDLRFVIVADRFLHHMVRYLVSTQVEIGTGRREEDEMETLLERGSTSDASVVRPPSPAPAGGLYLTGVRYPEGWNREPGVPGLTARPDGKAGARAAPSGEGGA